MVKLEKKRRILQENDYFYYKMRSLLISELEIQIKYEV